MVKQNYPNPFNPNTSLFFSIPEAENVDLRIYDVMGRLVRNFSSGFYLAGSHTVQWNGRDDREQTVSSGIYFCEIKFQAFRRIIKMQLIR
jgi:flagellar hook assembly protein FlgD